ncbi:Type IV secretion system protein virB5 precursor [compost metagenome]
MKKIHSLAFAGVMFCALMQAPVAYASGIPTVDAANLAQMISDAQAQAQQALDALNTAKDGIEQARQQYEHYKGIVTGNDQLGDFLNDPALNRVLPMGDWADMYEDVQDITDLRGRYGLTSKNIDVQAKFDQLLAMTGALEANYNASTERVKNAEKLRQKLNEVQTPQEKEDLNLRYQQEFLELQNQQLRLANMKMLSDEKRRIDSNRTAQEIMERMDAN